MKLINLVLFLLLLSTNVKSESYLILSLQGQTGQNNLKHSTSVITNIGLGLKTNNGFYVDGTLGASVESLAEIILDDDFEHDENRQRMQMDLLAGYTQIITDTSFIKIGAGIETAVFDENCRFEVLNGRRVCERRHEYGPTYKLGYFFRSRQALLFGLEYNRDELSDRRKYNGLSLVVQTSF